MQRAARGATGLVGVGLGLFLSSCSDEAAAPIADELTIRWQLQNNTVSFKPHAPGDGVKFDVSCAISGDNIDFTIDAPQVNDEERPASRLRVQRGNPGAGTCSVEVSESPNIGDGEFDLSDKCKGTDPMGGCTLTGAFNSDGWDFSGTLTCNKLVQEPGGPTSTLFDSVNNMGPVIIKLDNCD